MAGLPPHPTYPNPTVVQALCYVEFRQREDSTWAISKPKPVFDALPDFPIVEPINTVQQVFQATPGGPGMEMSLVGQSVQQYKLNNEEKTRYAVVSENTFMFGYAGAYPGWLAFRDHFLATWTKFATVATPVTVTRLSLRYVNVIPRTDAHPSVSDWISPTRSIPETFVSSKRDPFLLRVESWFESDQLIIMTLGLTGTPEGRPPMFFDIDRQSLSETHELSEAKMSEAFERLHTDVWNEFSSAKTPTFESFLNRKPE